MMETRENDATKPPLKVAATPGEMEKVKEKLEQYFPESAMIHGGLLTRTAYKELSDFSPTQFLYSDHSSLVVATPTFSQRGIQSICLFWDVETEDDDRMAQMLLTLPNFDWTKPVFFYATAMTILGKMERLATDGILGDGMLKPHKASICHFYSLTSPPVIETPRLPEGLELRITGEEHAQHMLDHWEYNFSEENENYRRFMKIAPGMGVFRIEQRNNENKHEKETLPSESQPHTNRVPDSCNLPVAWTHLSPFNVFTNTFTMPKYRGQKLAYAVTMALVNKALQDTGVASVNIGDDNDVSIRMHEKIGFKKQYALGYQHFKSSLTNCIVDEESPFS